MKLFNQDALNRLAEHEQQWEETSYPDFSTMSGVPIKRLYTPLDLADMDYEQSLGFPGEYPFTRGIHATMHRGRLWTMRMFAGFGSAEETNARFKYLLEALDCVRPAHTLRLRYRRPTRRRGIWHLRGSMQFLA